MESKWSKSDKENAELKSIEQMKQYFLSISNVDNDNQIQMATSNEIIYPFDLNDIIIYVKNIINEYEVLRGSL